MHDSFFGFYPPTSNEFDRIWHEALIIFDTNALLDLYRLPPKAREELFVALEHFKERLWIPYQVGLEVQRNRFKVISTKRKTMSTAMRNAETLLSDLTTKLQGLKLEQHNIGFDPNPALSQLGTPLNTLSDAIKKAQESEPTISASDEIRDRLDNILQGRVGSGPRSQEELDTLCADADSRYELRIPPGFADLKEKDGQWFVHDHLKYENKHGDLILWRQALDFIKEKNIKCVLFVTSEQKEDWWWKEDQDRIIGPHQELMREMRRVAGVELFWMYRTDAFLQHSEKYTKQIVSPESVADIANLVESDHLSELQRKPDLLEGSSLAERDTQLREHVLQAVEEWLDENRGYTFTPEDPGYDLSVLRDRKTTGYLVEIFPRRRPRIVTMRRLRGVFERAIENYKSKPIRQAVVIVLAARGVAADTVASIQEYFSLHNALNVFEEVIVGRMIDNAFVPIVVPRSGAVDHDDLF